MNKRGDLLVSNIGEALTTHKKYQGKLEMISKVPISTSKDLSLAYSPGVAEPFIEIFKDVDKVYDYTIKGNLVVKLLDRMGVKNMILCDTKGIIYEGRLEGMNPMKEVVHGSLTRRKKEVIWRLH